MKYKLLTIAMAAIALSGCDVEKTQSGEMPEVDVDVSADAGELPNYEVDWANVDVGTKTETVMVPEVVIAMEETEVDVPYVDVNMPDDDSERMERTIIVEAEVKDSMHELNIERVFAKDRRLMVISSLSSTGQPIDGNTVRVSDRLVLNAPDLDVKHFIIGEKPQGDWNNQYTFVSNEAEMRSKLEGATEIYTK
uniref:hypothetical protein n=1 Tax=Ningiella ruwaisensis TaxID=2364274 RepID=UPI00109F5500|nr:hypothetical protein [Ningiella ruwaisensis]